MGAPRVSVIMNVRNGAPFLREALDSALAQTFRDWELVFWDDCSTDDSAKIVAEYADPRIRYFLSPEETTLGPSRKFAIRHARGEWLAFLDQDDVWLPDKLVRQIELADADLSGRVGMIYGRTVEFFADGRENDFDTHHEFRYLAEGDLFEEFFRNSCFVMISSAMLRRSALEKIGEIPSDSDLTCDFYIFVAVARFYRVLAVQRVVCRYRRHATSLSRIKRVAMHQEALLLVKRWAGDLNPAVSKRARRYHQTLIAWIEIRRPQTFARGIARLLFEGSVGYALSRPFARITRWIRRRIQRPLWKFPPPPQTAGQ